MKIIDQNDNVIENPDMKMGKLVPDEIIKEHHPAVEGIEEEGHYETIAEYENGGKDVSWVIDVPRVYAEDAWDEYEDVMRYVPYTEEEIAMFAAPTTQDDMDEMMIDHEYRLTMLELGLAE